MSGKNSDLTKIHNLLKDRNSKLIEENNRLLRHYNTEKKSNYENQRKIQGLEKRV